MDFQVQHRKLKLWPLACFSDVKYRQMEIGFRGYFPDLNDPPYHLSKSNFVDRCCACARSLAFTMKAPNPIFPKAISVWWLEQFKATVCDFKVRRNPGFCRYFCRNRKQLNTNHGFCDFAKKVVVEHLELCMISNISVTEYLKIFWIFFSKFFLFLFSWYGLKVIKI